MFKKIFKHVKTGSEWIELLWKFLTLLLILFGTTVTALWAKASEQLNELGSFVWLLVGISSGLVFSLMVFLINLSKQKNAEANKLKLEANYFASLSNPRSTINPLAEIFTDQIIYLPDLYLPRQQIHKNKVFKRCKLVGPGAIALAGGSYINSSFNETGSILLLPEDAMFTGVRLLANCTLEGGERIGITILTNKQAAMEFKKMGAHVAGAI